MIKNILKTVRGFSPVELVIMVGFAALAAGALIFLATTPHYMAQQPVDININVEGAATISKDAAKALAKLAPQKTGRHPSANAAFGDPNPDTANITLSDGSTAATGGGTEDTIWVYPSGKKWFSWGYVAQVAPNKITPQSDNFTEGGIREAFEAGYTVYAKNVSMYGESPIATVSAISASGELTLDMDIFAIGDMYAVYAISDYMFRSWDTRNIQWAVDNIAPGGTVVMKALKKDSSAFTAFQFPEWFDIPGYFGVEIYQDATLTGETLSGQTFSGYHTDLDGKPKMTAIEGGYAVIATFAKKAIIKDLVVKGARDLGIASYPYFDWTIYDFDIFTDTYSEFNNIKVVDMIYPNDWTLLPFFSHTNGKWVVKNCMTREHPDNDFSEVPPVIHNGIAYAGGSNFWDVASANVEFTDNDVVVKSSPYGSGGLFIIQSYNLADPKVRNVLIKNNSVVADHAIVSANNVANVQILDNPAPGGQVIGRSTGIMAFDPFSDIPLASSAKVYIKGNNVKIDSTESAVEPWFIPFSAGFAGIDLSAGLFMGSDLTSLSNAVVSNNTFTGTATFGVYMGDHPWGIINEGDNNTFESNDFLGLSAEFAQMYFGPSVSKNTATSNKIGKTDLLGIVIEGKNNKFSANDYSQSLIPGWPSGAGCILLSPSSIGNQIKETLFPSGTTMCDQILDLPKDTGAVGTAQATADAIPGYGACKSKNTDVITRVQDAISKTKSSSSSQKPASVTAPDITKKKFILDKAKLFE